ncbi:hypothetical protein SAMD00079811_32000 [Scytonema sp. HK-05]|uniref:hypothetical protein n=1 Tax=Scytonema sp. HK-05 TaxID=1137095 RepID=UPI000936FBAC|nr:hypothetical protein [Scytonema sp. HK-05]BAY45594.1 hypothetical protein SAMD00079811_32000 [Scytonema sp. HK-05]
MRECVNLSEASDDITLLDTAAALAMTDNIQERRVLYEACDGLRVPAVFHHFDYILNQSSYF